MKLAGSLARAARDEFVYVGRRGEVRSPLRYKVQQGTALSLAIGAGVAGTALCFAIGAPWISLVYLSALGYVGQVWWFSDRLKQGAALLANERIDEADRRLRALVDSRWTPRSLRALAWQNLSGVAARRGRHEQALQYSRNAGELLARLRLTPVGPWRWINRFSEAQLLAQLGRLEEARRLRDSLQEAPDGEYFQILRINTDLLIAFMSDEPGQLPDDLFAWVKIALETTTAELALALLAWAHVVRGDEDMGLHLLSEARNRIDPRLFSVTYPKVYRWLQSAAPGNPPSSATG